MPIKRKRSIPYKNREREPRINEKIRAPEIRVLTEEDGTSKSEVMSRKEGLAMAKSLGLDLIEISPKQVPPVCRISDYGKFRFEQKKMKKIHAKKQQNIGLKEVKIRPKIAQNDLQLKKRNILAFLAEGNKVKVSMRFRGREIVYPEIGEALLTKLVEETKEDAQVENPLKKEGRQLIMVLGPKGKIPVKPSKPSQSASKNISPQPQPKPEPEHSEMSFTGKL